MEFIVIGVVAMLASILTFFSGFGLGTILLPVFALFFPVDVSIAMTAIVHLVNNALKIGFVGKYINWKIVIKFGSFAVVGAVIGAEILGFLTTEYSIATYNFFGRTCTITPVKITIGVLMLTFAFFEMAFQPPSSEDDGVLLRL